MEDNSCTGKKHDKPIHAKPETSQHFRTRIENLFFKETDLGLGIILEPDGKIHTITSNKGSSRTSVAFKSQLIPIADIQSKLCTLGKYAVLSHYDSMGGSYFMIYPCQTIDELGETLDSKVGIQKDNGSSDMKHIAVLGLNGKDIWIKKPEEVKFKRTYTIE